MNCEGLFKSQSFSEGREKKNIYSFSSTESPSVWPVSSVEECPWHKCHLGPARLSGCHGNDPRGCFLPSETPKQSSRSPLPFVPYVLGALDFLWDGLFLPRCMGSQLADMEEDTYMYNIREELSD